LSGTFSSVYLGYDLQHDYHDNSYWIEPTPDDGEDRPRVKVALKKILATSSPARIANELAILEALR
jgi:cell division control protein 7